MAVRTGLNEPSAFSVLLKTRPFPDTAALILKVKYAFQLSQFHMADAAPWKELKSWKASFSVSHEKVH